MISVCVPIYNTEPYIERCVRSLMEQTCSDVEYVFVDDVSTDGSLVTLERVLSAYPDRQSRIRIYKNESNRGVAYTKDRLLKLAAGEWVVMVDSDDYVEPDMVEKLYAAVVSHDADVAYCGMIHEYVGYTESEKPYRFVGGDDYVRLALEDKICYLCSAIFCRSLFESEPALVPEGLDYGEDRLITLKAAYRAGKMTSIDECLYHYVHRQGSISAQKTEKHFIDSITYWREAEAFLRSKGLAENYAGCVAFGKVYFKTHLMLHTRDNALRRRYANLYREEEKTVMRLLSRGYWLMSHIIHYRLWLLLPIYQLYIDMRSKNRIRV